MKIDIEKRDAVFDAFNEANNKYHDDYNCFVQHYKEIEQGYDIAQNLKQIQELENDMDQLGEQLAKLKNTILKWATGEEPLPVK